MPAASMQYSTDTIADATPDRATAVVIASQPSVNADPWQQRVNLSGYAVVTPGADTTEVAVSLRRGSTVIATQAITVDPMAIVDITFDFEGYEFAPIGQHAYSLVIEQTDASADATVLAVSLVVNVSG